MFLSKDFIQASEGESRRIDSLEGSMELKQCEGYQHTYILHMYTQMYLPLLFATLYFARLPDLPLAYFFFWMADVFNFL